MSRRPASTTPETGRARRRHRAINPKLPQTSRRTTCKVQRHPASDATGCGVGLIEATAGAAESLARLHPLPSLRERRCLDLVEMKITGNARADWASSPRCARPSVAADASVISLLSPGLDVAKGFRILSHNEFEAKRA